MHRLVCSLLVLSQLFNVTFTLDKVKLDEEGNFVDSNGRVMLLHGFNSVNKQPPWYHSQMTNKTQLKMFQEWGINVVRLGVMWAGVFPQEGVVDHQYMDKIGEIIDACLEYDIYVLIDLHQDVLAKRFGTYDGIPPWLTDRVCQTPSALAYPWPMRQPPSNWALNYLTYACMNCATNLYTNHSNSWGLWGDYWEVVAKYSKGKPNVIGYELMNEPPLANVYKNPLNALPSYVGKNLLLPTYDYLVERIRRVDQHTLIFYEPLTYGVFLPPSPLKTGTGIYRAPGSLQDPEAGRKSVLSYHYYCWQLQVVDAHKDMTFIQKIVCDHFLLPAVLKNSLSSIKRAGGGRFLTEFGLCAPDGNPKSINTVECKTIMKTADRYFQSWTYWDDNFLDEFGNPKKISLPYFVRVYPQLTAGTSMNYEFDAENSKFSYTFSPNATRVDKQGLLVEIAVPTKVHYPNGFKIEVDPDYLETQLVNEKLLVRMKEHEQQKLPGEVTVKIYPAQ